MTYLELLAHLAQSHPAVTVPATWQASPAWHAHAADHATHPHGHRHARELFAPYAHTGPVEPAP